MGTTMTGQLPEPDETQPQPPIAPQYPNPQYPSQQYPAPPTNPYGTFSAEAYAAPPANPYIPAPRRSRRRSLALKAGAGATAAVAVAALSFAAGTTQAHTHVVHAPSASAGAGSVNGQYPFGGFTDPNYTGPAQGQNGLGGSGESGSGTGTTATATAAQSVGVVDIDTNLKYQGAQAAGTGMILDSSGDILTNNHVIDGATTIKVTVVSTGTTYTAKVVGTDPTQDIAVVRLVNASGLTPANFGDSSTVQVGNSVTGVGNAGGSGGTPSAAAGKVLALGQSITAGDEGGANAEKLPNVIETNAAIQPGDSGGPLYNAKNQVVGIDTAANTSGTTRGFAIPINVARSLASQILSGNETTSIHIGYPGFLGVGVAKSTTRSGAKITGVLSGGPAASSGIVAGDVITRVGSAKIASPTALSKVMVGLDPGTKTTVTYVNTKGQTHTTSITLATGPAD
jgi:S1-C subfamily serine protease